MFVISVQPHWKPTQPTTFTTAICYLTPGRGDRGEEDGFGAMPVSIWSTMWPPQDHSHWACHSPIREPEVTVRRQPCLAKINLKLCLGCKSFHDVKKTHPPLSPNITVTWTHFQMLEIPNTFFPCWPDIGHLASSRLEREATDLARSSFLGYRPLDPHRLGWCHSHSYIWGDSGRQRFVFLPSTHEPLTWDHLLNLTWRTFTASLKHKEVSCRVWLRCTTLVGM